MLHEPHAHDDDTHEVPGTGPDGLVTTMVDHLAGLLARLTAELAWDSPALVVPVHLEPADVPDGLEVPGADTLALRWSAGTPTELVGHPFTALIGRRLPAEAVGAVLVVEGWMGPGAAGAANGGPDGTCALDDDLAAHPGPDGRAEVRSVTVALRDGTCALRVLVRGGTWHVLDGALDGRVPAALARYVGRPSGLAPDDPCTLARRAWVARALEVALAVEDTVVDDLPDSIRDAAAALGARRPGDLALYAMATDEMCAAMLPPEWGWLAARVHPAVGWDELVTPARESLPAGCVTRLVAAASELPPDGAMADQPTALAWCDGAMLGTWFHEALPTEARLDELAQLLRERGTISLGPDEVRSLARVATGTS